MAQLMSAKGVRRGKAAPASMNEAARPQSWGSLIYPAEGAEHGAENLKM